MTPEQFDQFTAEHPHIEHAIDPDETGVLFKNTQLPWYQHEGNYTRVAGRVLPSMTSKELLRAINRGLDLEHITRITGYFTKVSGWNKGKLGELKDRYRNDNAF